MVSSLAFKLWPAISDKRQTSAPTEYSALLLPSRGDDRCHHLMQDYKIDTSIDAHQHVPNAHMYWIPSNMMLNAISGIAPIS